MTAPESGRRRAELQPRTHGRPAPARPRSKPMPLDTEILLCDCTAGFDDTRRFARLDELTLTYDVVERAGDGDPRVLRRHVASLREARAHACASRPGGVACPSGPEASRSAVG